MVYWDGVVVWVVVCLVDMVVVSYFVVINAVIGLCLGDDCLVIVSFDNCSCIVVEIDGVGWFCFVEWGYEVDMLIW